MPSINEKRLAALSPTAFENLTFDLVRADLMENVHWRTPGADGGRDIEGELTHRDFAGHTRRSRWLIECKRYKAAVDWPTVWPKVAYADNSQADFLLMVTTGKFSTRCLDEIEKWNSRDRRPAIRVWPGHEVAFRLFLKPFIAVKYGLLDGITPSAAEVSGLALHVARMAQSAIAHSDPIKMARYIYAASSLASLLYTRSADLVQAGTFRDSDHASSEALPDFISGVVASELAGFDWIGLLSYMSCLHVIVKKPLIATKRLDGTLFVSTNHGLPAGLPDIALLREVAFWSSLTVTIEGDGICLTPQVFV